MTVKISNFIEQQSNASATAVASGELLACVAQLEADMVREQKAIDQHVSREEFGRAEYCKGREHAFALASLRVKRLIKQANVELSESGG